MIRLGLIDFDTSHVVEFTKRYNHVDVDQDLWVEGARVVAGCPGKSEIMPERVAPFAKTLGEKYGIQMVDRPEDLIGLVDAIHVESNEGGQHLERAKLFLEARIPLFIDKPLACTTADAKAIAALAARYGVPIFSTSSLRFAPEVVAVSDERDALGEVLSAEAFTPASLHPRNPGLFHYGVHGVEMLFALMGPGCVSVTCTSTEKYDVATGQWQDGRLGTVRGFRPGPGMGFTAYFAKGVRSKVVDNRPVYSAMLRQIVKTFETGKPPIPIEYTIEIVAFQEAAKISADQGGASVALAYSTGAK